MSHTFEVYPAQLRVPTFEEVAALAEKRLRERLSAMGVESELELRVSLRTRRGREEMVRPAEGLFQWQSGKETYAWFEVVGVDGGCDVTYSEDREEIEIFRDEIKYNKTLPDDFLDRCLELGRKWTFRRSAGQPGVIALVYGYLAAALAELTEGFVYSDDGAWDRDLLPPRSAEFYAIYFYPERTREHVEWTTRCLEQLVLELRAGSQMLEQFLRAELLRIPTQHWSHYFPAQVAILRFLEHRYPHKVELTAGGFDEEGPYLRGRGIDWFADVLWQQEDLLELVDAIMTEVVLDLKRRPTQPFHTPSEVALDAARVTLLEKRVLEEASQAIRWGLL